MEREIGEHLMVLYLYGIIAMACRHSIIWEQSFVVS